MKSLLTLFPNASQSVQAANPQLSYSQVINTERVAAPAQRRGRMNKTEREFSLILEARIQRHEITEWKFESVKLRLGDGCWYVPDFFVRNGDFLKFIEIKGFLRDDARVKFIVAQEIHKWAKFEMWQKTKKEGWKRKL